MKILGQLIILFTGLIFGMWGVKREEKYISLIEELQLGLSIVENEISFALKPLPGSFTHAASSLKITKAFFIEAAKRASEGEACLFNLDLLPLKEKEKNTIYEVGIRLGRGSDKEQLALILKAISRLEESRQIYREKLKRVSPLWRWLSPLAALLLVLLSC
ncbi:MAG: stage III sporulation protein AB [Firmicutes bacterium]|nr:stage III sporulation protein AB [Bacillota bacterium]MDD4693896.1 stage III sporulation protein AB [Bacillota bacterium]